MSRDSLRVFNPPAVKRHLVQSSSSSTLTPHSLEVNSQRPLATNDDLRMSETAPIRMHSASPTSSANPASVASQDELVVLTLDTSGEKKGRKRAKSRSRHRSRSHREKRVSAKKELNTSYTNVNGDGGNRRDIERSRSLTSETEVTVESCPDAFVKPYTANNQLDIWYYPFVDHGTAYQAYYPPPPYGSPTRHWSNGCRSVPVSSALTSLDCTASSSCGVNAFGETGGGRIHRLIMPSGRRQTLGHVPVYIRGSGAYMQYAPPLAYQYTRRGVISSSSPPTIMPSFGNGRVPSSPPSRTLMEMTDVQPESSPGVPAQQAVVRRDGLQPRRCQGEAAFLLPRDRPDAAPSFDSSVALARALHTDGQHMMQCFQEMQSVMEVQSHEIRLMVSAIRTLREQVQSQKTQLVSAEVRKRSLESELAHFRKGGYGYTRRDVLDAMLRKAERQLGAALTASQRAGLPSHSLPQSGPSFFVEKTQNDIPGVPEPEIRVASVAIGRQKAPEAQTVSQRPGSPVSDRYTDLDASKSDLSDSSSSDDRRHPGAVSVASSDASEKSRQRHRVSRRRWESRPRYRKILRRRRHNNIRQTVPQGSLKRERLGIKPCSSDKYERSSEYSSLGSGDTSAAGSSDVSSSTLYSSESSRSGQLSTSSSASRLKRGRRDPQRRIRRGYRRPCKKKPSPEEPLSSAAAAAKEVLSSSLPNALQAVLIRASPGEGDGGHHVVVVADDKRTAEAELQPLDIQDLRKLEAENCRLHQIIATLEKRVHALYAELRHHAEAIRKERELSYTVQHLKQERDVLLNDQRETQQTINALRNTITTLKQELQLLKEETEKPSTLSAEASYSSPSKIVSSSSSSPSTSSSEFGSSPRGRERLLYDSKSGSIPRLVSSSSSSSSSSALSYSSRRSPRRVSSPDLSPRKYLPPRTIDFSPRKDTPTIITTLADKEEAGPEAAGTSGPARYTYSRVSRRHSSTDDAVRRRLKEEKRKRKKERHEEKERRRGERRAHEQRRARPTRRESSSSQPVEQSLVLKIPSGPQLIARKGRGAPTAASSPSSVAEGEGSGTLSSVPSEEKSLIEMLRNQVVLEQKRSAEKQRDLDQLLLEKERHKLEAELREDKLKTALQYQATLKEAETENLKARVESQEALLNRILGPSRPLTFRRSEPEPTSVSAATREAMREELQRAMTVADDRMRAVLDDAKQQSMVALDAQQQASQRERELREAMTRMERVLKQEKQRRADAEKEFTRLREAQKKQLENQKTMLLRASNELKQLRDQVKRTRDRDTILDQLKKATERRKVSESQLKVLQERFEQERIAYQQRLEESQRTFERIVAERDRLRSSLDETMQRFTGAQRDLQSTTSLLEKAEKTILDLSPETREKYIDALAERARSTDQQVASLQRQLGVLQQQKQQSEAIKATLQEDVQAAKRKLESLERMFKDTNAELERHTALLGEERMERLARERSYKEVQLRNAFLEKTLVEHVETIKQKDQKIKDCLENREKFKDALALIGQKYKNLERELESCESKLLAERAVVTDLMHVVENLRQRETTLQHELDTAYHSQRDLQDRLSRADLILIRRGAELNEVTKRLEHKAKEVKKVQEQYDDLQHNFSELHERYEALGRETSLTEERLSLSKSLHDFTASQSETVAQQNQQTAMELARTTAQLERVTRDLETVTGERDRLTLRVKALDVTVSGQLQEITTLETMVKEAQREVSTLNTRLDTLKRTEQRLLQDLGQAREKERAREHHLHDFETRLEEALKDKDKMIETLARDLEASQEELQQTRSTLHSLRSAAEPRRESVRSGRQSNVGDGHTGGPTQADRSTVVRKKVSLSPASENVRLAKSTRRDSSALRRSSSGQGRRSSDEESGTFQLRGYGPSEMAEPIPEALLKAIVSQLAERLPPAPKKATTPRPVEVPSRSFRAAMPGKEGGIRPTGLSPGEGVQHAELLGSTSLPQNAAPSPAVYPTPPSLGQQDAPFPHSTPAVLTITPSPKATVPGQYHIQGHIQYTHNRWNTCVPLPHCMAASSPAVPVSHPPQHEYTVSPRIICPLLEETPTTEGDTEEEDRLHGVPFFANSRFTSPTPRSWRCSPRSRFFAS